MPLIIPKTLPAYDALYEDCLLYTSDAADD